MRRFSSVLALVIAACALLGLGSLMITNIQPSARVGAVAAAAGDTGSVIAASNMITASARGEVQVGPDMATVTMGAVADGTTADSAQASVRAIISRVVAGLHGLKIPDAQIQTISIALTPRYSGKTTISGYEASQILLTTVNNVATVGKVTDAAVKAGATYGVRVDYGLRDANAPYLQAVAKATRIASAHAAAMASALGRSLTSSKVQIAEGGPVITHRTPLTIFSTGGLLDFRADVVLTYTF